MCVYIIYIYISTYTVCTYSYKGQWTKAIERITILRNDHAHYVYNISQTYYSNWKYNRKYDRMIENNS